MNPLSPQHAAALEYALGRGWYVFPLRPGMKIPATENGHLEATIDAERINAWWQHNPNYNVGIAVAPSNLVALDVDVSIKKDGTQKRGLESLQKIDRDLTPTLTSTTGRGGMHAVYARPEGVEARRLIDFLDKDCGLDLIGDGYIVASPSYLAETGRYYSWAHHVAIAPLPPLLQQFMVNGPARPTEKVQELGTPINEGNRNNALYKLGAALRDTGIGREALARALDAENHLRFNPPLPDPEVGQLDASVMTRVEVTRDVAAGAIVEQEMQAMFAPAAQEEWIDSVAAVPRPPVLFYSTGFPALDALLNGGFATGQCAGLIAPPSTGKSALVGHWILHLEKHRPVLHCSLELEKHELFVRYASHEMGFPWVDGVRGAVDQAAMANAVRGKRIKLMGSDNFDRIDPFGSLEAATARMTQECGISPIVVIDYVQIMARAASTEMRHKVGELTMRARQLAQRFATVVIGVFTTQRDKYQIAAIEKMRAAQDPRAYLGAAKESGDIEFDCAILMYLDVDMLSEGPHKPGQIAVSRCRYGHEGFVGIRAQLEFGRFAEDANAVAEFATEARAAKRDADDMENACKLVIEAVLALPGQGWAAIQGRVGANRGMNYKMADRARDKLLGEGVLAKEDRYENGRKVKNSFTLKVRNTQARPGVSPEEEAAS